MKLNKILTSILLIFLLFLTIFNIKRIISDTKKGSHSVQEIRNIYNNYSDRFFQKKFPVVLVKNIVDTTINLKTNFIDSTLVIIISKTGCSPCQLRELKNLAKLKIRKKTLNIIAILNNESRFTALKLKKIAQINFPFYYTYDKKINIFNTFNKYPLICLVYNKKVEKCLLPIPSDKQYSSLFYSVF